MALFRRILRFLFDKPPKVTRDTYCDVILPAPGREADGAMHINRRRAQERDDARQRG